VVDSVEHVCYNDEAKEGAMNPIGASQGYKVLGMGAGGWGGPVSVWAACLGDGKRTSASGLAASAGNRTEAAHLELAAEKIGGLGGEWNLVERQFHYSDEIAGRPDGTNNDVYDMDRVAAVLETKIVVEESSTWSDDPALEWWALRRWLNDEGPWPAGTKIEGYWCQVQQQMLCTGAPVGYLSGLIGWEAVAKMALGDKLSGREHIILRIPRAAGFQETLVRELTAFWEKHVVTGVKPPGDMSDRDMDAVRKHLSRSTEGSEMQAPDYRGVIRALARSRAMQKREKKREKALATRLMADFPTAELVVADDWQVSMKTDARGARVLRPKKARRTK
jgi:hypothetical protein